MSLRFTVALVVAAGCPLVGTNPPPRSLEELVADHVAASGFDYVDCGTLVEEYACVDVAAELQCLMEGFLACTPTRLNVQHATDDAGPIPETLLVEPRDGGCTVVSFQDHSGDGYKGDYGDLIERECDTLDTDTCYVALSDCVTIEEWYF